MSRYSKLKQSFETLSREQIELETRISSLKEEYNKEILNLKRLHKVDSIESAESLLSSLSTQIENSYTELSAKISALENLK